MNPFYKDVDDEEQVRSKSDADVTNPLKSLKRDIAFFIKRDVVFGGHDRVTDKLAKLGPHFEVVMVK